MGKDRDGDQDISETKKLITARKETSEKRSPIKKPLEQSDNCLFANSRDKVG